MKVLIVDDLPQNRKLLRINLEAQGIDSIEAADGLEALALLEQENPDAIISDIFMPQMDGYRFCQEVRKHANFADTPFIFYTSTYTSPGDERLALNCGADRYLKKPAPIAHIIDALRELSAPEVARPRASTAPPEAYVMREYNEALVRKLEERNTELEAARERIVLANEDLERRVLERTAELQAANLELEAFSHSLAHDLRSPLMAVDGFSQILLSHCQGTVDEKSMQYLRYISTAVHRMNDLTNDLLRLARANRGEMHREQVDLSRLAQAIAEDLQIRDTNRRVQFRIAPGLTAEGDQSLLRIALENLLNNAWKFTGKTPDPGIEFGAADQRGDTVFFIRDNGAGFDMAKAEKLFGTFVRLHSTTEFPGTGIGLATVQRIVRRHSGRIWAEAEQDHGATFSFTLGSILP